MTDRVALTVSHDYRAAAGRVFDAWLDPATAGRFLFATPDGEMIKVAIDPVAGGQFTFVERRDGKAVEHLGRYLEIARPRRLVFEFCVPAYSSEMSRVEVDIVDLPEGGCRLSLTAQVLPDYEARSREGWAKILSTLASIRP
ncbi:MAG: SRPBCC domain-containing protein [Caulobacter sp.]|nr:SRPBCC domain-containing protein [Caulobacter sp.]